ncbi:hypothetical protein [Pseudomonas sp. WS 5086]|uniref:hypothetical protein n=1 Tax=Pseudomonas sp. WS 5086 TaxID=2717484 RepID=UPI0014751E9C|nr:hypothetical protein [Pseudomonas sp. WS 5086]NMX94563.1 hypothetical protein [Pseudomonas sp. WS 5086]
MFDKFCKYCNALIERGSPQYHKKEYCSQSHQQMAHRRKNLKPLQKNRLKNLSANIEWLYISKACKRAGSVQIMSYHTVDSLKQLIGIICNKPKKKMDICHVYPVKGKDGIGLLHPLNLVYGDSDHNKKNGNKAFGDAGYYIERSELKHKWQVTEKMKDKTILRLLEKFLGAVLTEYVRKYPVKVSGRIKLIDEIIKLDKNGRYTRDNLTEIPSIGLSVIKAELLGATINGFYSPPKKNRSRILIYLEELSRVAKEGDGEWAKNCKFMFRMLLAGTAALSKAPDQPELLEIYKAHGKKAERYKRKILRNPSEYSKFKAFLMFQAYDCLHGKEVDKGMLKGTLHKYTKPIKDNSSFSFASISLKGCSEYSPNET